MGRSTPCSLPSCFLITFRVIYLTLLRKRISALPLSLLPVPIFPPSLPRHPPCGMCYSSLQIPNLPEETLGSEEGGMHVTPFIKSKSKLQKSQNLLLLRKHDEPRSNLGHLPTRGILCNRLESIVILYYSRARGILPHKNVSLSELRTSHDTGMQF